MARLLLARTTRVFSPNLYLFAELRLVTGKGQLAEAIKSDLGEFCEQ